MRIYVGNMEVTRRKCFKFYPHELYCIIQKRIEKFVMQLKATVLYPILTTAFIFRYSRSLAGAIGSTPRYVHFVVSSGWRWSDR